MGQLLDSYRSVSLRFVQAESLSLFVRFIEYENHGREDVEIVEQHHPHS